jgi:hypothetical protein
MLDTAIGILSRRFYLTKEQYIHTTQICFCKTVEIANSVTSLQICENFIHMLIGHLLSTKSVANTTGSEVAI